MPYITKVNLVRTRKTITYCTPDRRNCSNKIVHSFNKVVQFNKITLEQELNLITPHSKCLFYHVEFIITNIPQSIKTIQFYYNFNADIFPYLHENIKCLIFGDKFNKKVDNLPAKLEIIQFGEKFNQMVDNLPTGLRIIKFASEFNQSVEMLPESLEHIHFAYKFNQAVINLPHNIKTIKFGECFSYNIDNLPDSIEKIYFAPRSPKKINAVYFLEPLKIISTIFKGVQI